MAEPQRCPQVVIACAWFNRADYLSDTVDSLLAQSFDSFEIVLVNDGSTEPRVKEILDSYDDSRLRVIHQDNLGFVKAIRRAIDASRAPYIAIQGAGDVSYADRIETQWRHLSAREDLVGVACRVDQVIYGGVNTGLKEQRPKYKCQWAFEDFLKKTPFTHGEVMFRRDAYESVGGYRELFKYAQDRDLWLRLSEIGDFQIIDKYLYERRRFSDGGVSRDTAKKLLQKHLSDFATQCALDRRDFGFDFVQKYGLQGGLFRRSSGVVARVLAKSAVKYTLVNDFRSARHLNRVSLREKVTVAGAILFFMIPLSEKYVLFHRLFNRFLEVFNISSEDDPPQKPFAPGREVVKQKVLYDSE